MSLKSEKASAVKKYTKALAYKKDTTSSVNKIEAIFNQDTIDKKLYKYCSVGDFTYINILHNILHCSQPGVFNDPFDAHPGVSFSHLVQFDNAVLFNAMSEIFESAMKVLANTLTLQEVPSNYQACVQTLVNDSGFAVLMQRQRTGIPLTVHEVQNVMQSFIAAIAENWLSMPPDTVNQERAKEFLNQLTVIAMQNTDASIVNMSQLAAQYNPDWDVDNADAICLLSEQLYAADAVIGQFQKLNNNCQELICQMRTLLLIGCLTTSPKNRLMWSHYASYHRGICIEYDFSSFNFKSSIIPLPVCYTTRRPCLDINPQKLPTKQQATALLAHALLQKDADWQYENEWRIFMNSESDGNFKMPPISCIYLGACISDVHKEIICNLAKQQGIQVKQMKMDREIYELHAHPV